MDRVDLLVIDPQVDFCVQGKPLYVKGAEADMSRLSTMVKRLKEKISQVHVTLDSHHLLDVGHPIFWKDSNGNHPTPITIITAKDIESGAWSTTIPSFNKRMQDYARKLEANNRYPLTVWPPHCLIGSDGAKVIPELFDALIEWESLGRVVDYVTKGSNIFTEHYSGLMADVIDPADITTQLNRGLINTIEKADMILVAGEASSHCVANTLRDLIANFSNSNFAQKVWIIEDAMSPVGTFEQMADDFFTEMKAKGVNFTTTSSILA